MKLTQANCVINVYEREDIGEQTYTNTMKCHL